MKKIIALILAVAVVFALCIPALAVESPVAKVYYNVVLEKGKTDGSSIWNGKTASVEKGKIATVYADPSLGTFINWTVTGADYSVINGSLTSEHLSIVPKGDVKIVGNYKATEKKDNTDKYVIQVVDGDGVNEGGKNDANWNKDNAEISVDSDKNQLVVKADENKGDFNNWTVYTVETGSNGKRTYKQATEGVDYKVVVDDLGTIEELIEIDTDYTADLILSSPTLFANVLALDPSISKEDALKDPSLLKDIIDNNTSNVAGLFKKDTDALEKLTSKYNDILLDKDSLRVIPLNDIVIAGNYDGKTSDPAKSEDLLPSDSEKDSTSPKNGESTVLFVFIALISLAGVSLSTKKVLSK